MSELEEKLGAVLQDPQLMQQLQSMAQSLGIQPQQEPQQTAAPPDLKMIQSLSGMAQLNHVDSDQQALLQALQPYLSRERVSKLEKAMRAARLAGAASSFLNAGGLQFLTGR